MSYELNRGGSIPSRSKRSFFSACRPTLRPTQPPIQWVSVAVSLGVHRRGPEADHPPPSSAVLKNNGTIPPLPKTSSWRND
jgi:hypothetical protein